ncbi:MAG: hypothetical protein D6720_09515 [Gammaproteobacteria bacterium]|nr:MAG: hypothetical protein D6720_09515 [Gammaproteobacteria bacterium]
MASSRTYPPPRSVLPPKALSSWSARPTCCPPPIVAPLTQTPCCWYSYRVERRSDRHWRTLRSGTSDELFLLRDETGECVIDPEGADVDSIHSQIWAGSANSLGTPGLHAIDRNLGPAARWVSQTLGAIGAFTGEYRYQERVILPGDPLYAIGWFQSLDDSDWSESERARATELLREWKRRPETLRERFDHNRDGVIDQEEWEDARRAARLRAKEELAEARPNTHVHMMSRPKGRHYLIANREERLLVRRYRWQAILGFAAFFGGLSLVAAWLSGHAI